MHNELQWLNAEKIKFLRLWPTKVALNGRVKGDRQGEFTTTHNSEIDYCIGSPDVIDYIDILKIEDYDNIFSDVHCKFFLYIKNSLSVSEKGGSNCIKRINNCNP